MEIILNLNSSQQKGRPMYWRTRMHFTLHLLLQNDSIYTLILVASFKHFFIGPFLWSKRSIYSVFVAVWLVFSRWHHPVLFSSFTDNESSLCGRGHRCKYYDCNYPNREETWHTVQAWIHLRRGAAWNHWNILIPCVQKQREAVSGLEVQGVFYLFLLLLLLLSSSLSSCLLEMVFITVWPFGRRKFLTGRACSELGRVTNFLKRNQTLSLLQDNRQIPSGLKVIISIRSRMRSW